jgi:hypothetical protein
VVVELRREAVGERHVQLERLGRATGTPLGFDLRLDQVHRGKFRVRPKAEPNPTDPHVLSHDFIF